MKDISCVDDDNEQCEPLLGRNESDRGPEGSRAKVAEYLPDDQQQHGFVQRILRTLYGKLPAADVPRIIWVRPRALGFRVRDEIELPIILYPRRPGRELQKAVGVVVLLTMIPLVQLSKAVQPRARSLSRYDSPVLDAEALTTLLQFPDCRLRSSRDDFLEMWRHG